MGQSDYFQWLIMKYQPILTTNPSYSACVVYNNGTGQMIIPDSYEALQSRCLQKKKSKLECTKEVKNKQTRDESHRAVSMSCAVA